MTEKEKLKAGLVYDPMDRELMSEQEKLSKALWKFNRLAPNKVKAKQRYIKKHFGSAGQNVFIELPFRANWGGKNFHVGNNFYANFNLTLVDDGDIIVGNDVLIGPNVTIATANHPSDPKQRAKGLQYVKNVTIGNNVWIGANVFIAPGVTIGDNVIIGGGSVVVKDIESDSLAVGNPCKVIRKLEK